MRFPPRCYYCHRVIRSPFGLVIFRGARRLHVAHRSCRDCGGWSRGGPLWGASELFEAGSVPTVGEKGATVTLRSRSLLHSWSEPYRTFQD
jgi:hypothetical protein